MDPVLAKATATDEGVGHSLTSHTIKSRLVSAVEMESKVVVVDTSASFDVSSTDITLKSISA